MDFTNLTCPFESVTYETWMNNGMSNFTIIIAVSAFFYLLIFDMIYLRQCGQKETDNAKLPKSSLYQLQKFLLQFMPVFSVLDIILHIQQVYGYMIVSRISSFIVYPYSIELLKLEKQRMLTNESDGNNKILFVFWILNFINENIIFINSVGVDWPFEWDTTFDRMETVLYTSRYITSIVIFSLGILTPSIYKINFSVTKNEKNKDDDEEKCHSNKPNDKSLRWQNVWYNLKFIATLLWPKADILLQLRLIVCFALPIVVNFLGLWVPYYEKQILDSVIQTRQIRWDLIMMAMGNEIFCIMATRVRRFLWDRIDYQTTYKMSIGIFRHLHSLSLGWHLNRKTGEVLSIIDRGINALDDIIYFVFFGLLPTIIDTTLVAILLIRVYDKWLAIIAFSYIIFYTVLLIVITEWHGKARKRLNEASNKQRSQSMDSLINFETVKSFGAEWYEIESYGKAIRDIQTLQRKSDIIHHIFYMSKNFIDFFGSEAGSLISLHMLLRNEELTIGDHLLFMNYISYIKNPLNGLVSCYRGMYENFVNAESLFKLLKENQDVVDLPDAKPLEIEEGQIRFSDVSFSYLPEKPVLKNINFVVPPGKTLALVGSSGSGKTTITRLLFRFYDTKEGSIFIDDQDIKTVKQQSLREAIGIVPQDTVLFNNTIKYNIRYGKIHASDEEVIEAAKNADIHDRILTFPDGYDTEVGERGLRLSGGEKQRVAIARTILKAPKIVLLDEATSALDTQTERNIQSALRRVCENRTTIIIAHRLSTIIHADEILVLKDGEIVERGRHEEMLMENGIYRDMWEAQMQMKDENETKNEKEDGSTE